jgi:hypothetical protein
MGTNLKIKTKENVSSVLDSMTDKEIFKAMKNTPRIAG